MLGRSCLPQRAARRRRQLVALREEHRVAGLRRPGRGGHREPRVVGRDDHHVLRGRPAVGRERVDRGCERERVAARDRRCGQSGGARALPISIACAPPQRRAPLGRSESRAVGGRLGTSSPSVSRIGARRGGAGQHGGRDAAAPVAAVDERHGARAGCPRVAPDRPRADPRRRPRSGSSPPMRVVFFVASAGKPSTVWSAVSSSQTCTSTGLSSSPHRRPRPASDEGGKRGPRWRRARGHQRGRTIASVGPGRNRVWPPR